MSLNSTNFVVKGPIKSVDMKQFVDLFTGVMLDQPVTFKNAVMIGGAQGSSTPPLKLFGVTSQTGNLIELYPTAGSATPTFGFGAVGNFAWGPGSPAANDTFLSRVALQNGHVTDTAGLLISPYLEVQGNIRADGFTFTNQATLTGPAANPFRLVVNQDLVVNRRYMGDFSNATPSNRTAFQSSTTDGTTLVYALPNGAGTIAGFNVSNNSTLGNNGFAGLSISPTAATLTVGILGTGAYVPLLFNVNNAERLRVTTSGEIQCGPVVLTSAYAGASAAPYTQRRISVYDDGGNWAYFAYGADAQMRIVYASSGGGALLFGKSTATNNTGAFTQTATLDPVGNLNVNGSLSAGAITPGAPGDLGASRGGGVGVVYLADTAHYLINNGGIFTLAGGPLTVTGTVTASGYLANADGQGLTIIDGNTRIISSARVWYFDQYAGGWFFRNSAAGLATAFSVDAAGNVSAGGQVTATGSVVAAGNGLTTGPAVCLEASKAVKLFYDSSVAAVNIPYGNGVQSPYFRAQSGFVAQNGNIGLGLESGYNISCYGSALGTWVARSDRRLKENLVSIPDSACLAQIVDTTMPVYSFAWKDDETAAPQSGFVADEVYDEVPVYANVDEEGFPNAINYSQMVPTLWSAVRELAARIEKLEVA